MSQGAQLQGESHVSDALEEARNRRLSFRFDELLGKLGTLQEEVGSLRGELGFQSRTILELRGELGITRGELGTKLQTIEALQGELGTKLQTIDELRGELGTKLQTVDELRGELGTTQRTTHTLQESLGNLETKVNKLQEMSKKDRGIVTAAGSPRVLALTLASDEKGGECQEGHVKVKDIIDFFSSPGALMGTWRMAGRIWERQGGWWKAFVLLGFIPAIALLYVLTYFPELANVWKLAAQSLAFLLLSAWLEQVKQFVPAIVARQIYCKEGGSSQVSPESGVQGGALGSQGEGGGEQ